MNEESLKIQKLIQQVIFEHNKIWHDITTNIMGCPRIKPGDRDIKMKEEDIITLASGLVRKGVFIK